MRHWLLAIALMGGAAQAAPLSLDAAVGQQVFERLWVAAPSSTKSSDGLGPLYNARSCAACHPRAGRGAAYAEGNGTVVRLAVPGDIPEGTEALPHAQFGHQLQGRSTAGVAAEPLPDLTWHEHTDYLADGTVVPMRAPILSGLPDGSSGALRAAPDLHSSAAIAEVPDAVLLDWADPDDADGDGISGRVNRVAGGQMGRFGWKAAEPTLPAQIAAAFARDIGLSSTWHPEGYGDCTAAQTDCRGAPNGNTEQYGNVEVPDVLIALTESYLLSLDPAAPSPEGRDVFDATGCASCHTTEHGAPHSDLLLHDMGPDLADARREWDAAGAEWRTAPLTGLRHRAAVDEPTYYLHDNRARSLFEAILWHGGEASAARESFRTLPPADREALMTYLESL